MKPKKVNLGAYDMDYEMGGFGDPSVAGPMIGGGITNLGVLGSKLIFKGKAPAKYAGLIGTGLGLLVSGILTARSGTRQLGIAGLVTSALVGLPKQLEDYLEEKGMLSDYLGIVAAEQMMNGGLGAEQAVELLDPNLGVVTAEQGEMGAVGPASDVELLGGFGTNFMNHG